MEYFPQREESGEWSWRTLTLQVRERAKAEKDGRCWTHILLGGKQRWDAQENPRAVLGSRPVPMLSETLGARPWGQGFQSPPCHR